MFYVLESRHDFADVAKLRLDPALARQGIGEKLSWNNIEDRRQELIERWWCAHRLVEATCAALLDQQYASAMLVHLGGQRAGRVAGGPRCGKDYDAHTGL